MKPRKFESVTHVNTDNMHAYVGMHALIFKIRKDTCFELFSSAAILISKGLGQARRFLS